MPRAHPTAIRHQILGLRSQGLSLVQIASQLLLPYSSVRRLCRRHRDDPARPLNPDYSRCGRRHTAATEALFQAARALKRNHPTWGAGIIRVQLSEQYPGQAVPSVRALQQAFRRAGVNRPRPPRPSTPATPRATVPHQIWEVDAKERVRLASGQRVSWLAFTDEASGALLATPLSPQGRWQNVPPTAIRDMFRRTFTRWGLPEAVRVDNGYPWGSPRDLPTELALWLIGLGVAVIWNPPAQPRKNPKVERCQGVAAAWTEPQACADPAAFSAHLDWVGRVQCREYPSIGGSTRVEAYPGLLIARRAYQESQEPTLWELGRVDRWVVATDVESTGGPEWGDLDLRPPSLGGPSLPWPGHDGAVRRPGSAVGRPGPNRRGRVAIRGPGAEPGGNPGPGSEPEARPTTEVIDGPNFSAR